jgi:hypothetical protein
MVDWPYSSFGEYSYLNNYGIINQKLGLEILQLTNSYFANDEIIQYNDEEIDALF